MLLIDVNLLLYAHMKAAPEHLRAHEWLDRQLNGSARIGMPWMSLLGFIRVSTNPRSYIKPETVAGAVRQVQDWLAHDLVWIPQPTERHPDLLSQLLLAVNAGGNTVPDAHLAAIAIEHGLTLCSNDGGFARFKNLSWTNPLAA